MIEQRDLAAETVREAPAAVAERDRIVKKYAVLCQQQTTEGKTLVGLSNGFTKDLADFSAAAEAEKQSLPKQIDEHLAEARQYAADAVKEQKPLFFTGGIPQRFEWAEEKINLLKALDANAGAAAEKKLADARAELKKAQDALREQIIAANDMPRTTTRAASATC